MVESAFWGAVRQFQAGATPTVFGMTNAQAEGKHHGWPLELPDTHSIAHSMRMYDTPFRIWNEILIIIYVSMVQDRISPIFPAAVPAAVQCRQASK